MSKPTIWLAAIGGIALSFGALVVFDHRNNSVLEAELIPLGFQPDSESVLAFLTSRFSKGLSPTAVRLGLPAPKKVEWFVVAGPGADSLLLERYYIGPRHAPMPLYLYYQRGGGLIDWYVDDPPSIKGSIRLDEHNADLWRTSPSKSLLP